MGSPIGGTSAKPLEGPQEDTWTTAVAGGDRPVGGLGGGELLKMQALSP
jgi:hypothetical protein